jgi:anaerobic magnesium-protoporphyrin IX monomethyl ester cyclase
MKLLIVSPNSSNLYQDLSDKHSAIEPNIWAGLLANSVRKNCDVSIYDMEVERPTLEQFYDVCRGSRADLILFVVTGQNPNASSAAMSGATRASKSIWDNGWGSGKIAFVGPHVNALPVETLERHPEIDIVLTNEGVYALRNLVSKGTSSEALRTINGIAYRDKDEIILNPAERIVPQDRLQEDLPGVAYDLMPPLSKYRTSGWHANYIEEDRSPFASIYTSLGCIFKCNFCMINQINRTNNDPTATAANFNTFRYWEPSSLIKQFDYLASQGVKQIKIADEMFVLKPKHFMTLCDLLIERDYGFNIWAYTRIDTVKEQYLEKLKAAGINWLALGIESGNQSIRREITKGKFEELDIRDVVSMIKSSGINTILNYIVGLGSDTWDTMQQTLNLALELCGDASNIYSATALPGSPLYMEAKLNGHKLPNEYSEFGFLSYDHIPDSTPTLSAKDIIAFRDYAFEVLHKNPRFLNMVQQKFGSAAVDNINRLSSVRLKRKLLGD